MNVIFISLSFMALDLNPIILFQKIQYVYHLFMDTGCRPEDLLRTIADRDWWREREREREREGERERVKGIRAVNDKLKKKLNYMYL